MIILEVFVFYKTYHLVLWDSTLVHRESGPSMHPRVSFFKVYSFVSCIDRTKLKCGAMKLNAYEKFIWMIELGAIYLGGLKRFFRAL